MEVKKVTSKEDFDNAFRIRKNVFAEEQGVSEEEEFDGSDADAQIVIAYYEGEPVGTGRLIINNDTAKLGRICVLKSHRKFGIGKAIVEALENAAKEKNIKSLLIHAQTHAVSFYKKAGFTVKADEAEFLEAGIPHVAMTKKI